MWKKLIAAAESLPGDKRYMGVKMNIFKMVFVVNALILLSIYAAQVHGFIQSSFSFECHIYFP